jgi:hypothetical protein
MKKEAVSLGANTYTFQHIEIIRIVVNTILYVIAVIVYRFKDVELKMSSSRYLFSNQQVVLCGAIFWRSRKGNLPKLLC